jgi:putative RNA 2'-phosphotransferase
MSSDRSNPVALSKTVAHALRHAPWQYELEPDEEGWVSVGSLLDGLRAGSRRWHNVTEADLVEMVERSDKRRYELRDGRIRALYGHSLPGRLSREPATPPHLLLHGTSRRVLDRILQSGLQPMRRQYVHLSADRATALEVARRKPSPHVVLEIDATAAAEAGVRFYLGNDKVWLADAVPPRFLRVEAAR